jgi:hypothetical protein
MASILFRLYHAYWRTTSNPPRAAGRQLADRQQWLRCRRWVYIGRGRKFPVRSANGRKSEAKSCWTGRALGAETVRCGGSGG